MLRRDSEDGIDARSTPAHCRPAKQRRIKCVARSRSMLRSEERKWGCKNVLIRRRSVRAAFSGKKRNARKGRLVGGDHGLAEGLEDVGCVLAADVSFRVLVREFFVREEEG